MSPTINYTKTTINQNFYKLVPAQPQLCFAANCVLVQFCQFLLSDHHPHPEL